MMSNLLVKTREADESSDGIFDENYYQQSCGEIPYERSRQWIDFFGGIADSIIQGLAPRTVFDAGCAWGFLVEALWDRGVVANGRDISAYAVANVRPDMKDYIVQGSLTEPIEGRYDLVTCIEVLEHMSAEEARRAIRHMTAVSDTILFSSTPDDFQEPTHINVQPVLFWLKLFNEFSFAPDPFFDTAFLTRHAILFRRRTQPLADEELAAYARFQRLRELAYRTEQHLHTTVHERNLAILEKDRHLAQREQQLRAEIADRDREIAERDRQVRETDNRLASLAAEFAAFRTAAAHKEDELQQERAAMEARLAGLLASRSWQVTQPMRTFGTTVRRICRAFRTGPTHAVSLLPQPLAPDHPWSRLTLSKTILRMQIKSGAKPVGWSVLHCELKDAINAGRIAILVSGPCGPVRLIPVHLGAGRGSRQNRHAFLVRLPDRVDDIALDLMAIAPETVLHSLKTSQVSQIGALRRMLGTLLTQRRIATLPALLLNTVRIYRSDGLEGLRRRMGGEEDNGEPRDLFYDQWIIRNDTLTDLDRTLIRDHIARFVSRPLISVVMPVYNPRHHDLRAAVASLKAQLYPHWELCIADDHSTDTGIASILAEVARSDPRIRVVHRPANGHISAASNSALELATGDFIALLDQDDLLSEHALYLVAELINRHPDADLIFSDEDKIDDSGRRFDPYFKPDWDPVLILGQNYFNHLGVYRTAVVREAGGFREGYEGSQDYDLLLRVSERTVPARIHHIAHICYHWRAIPGSTALAGSEKNYAHARGMQAVRDHLARTGVRAEVSPSPSRAFNRVRFPVPNPAPKVSLVIPTRDRVELLRTCVCGLLEGTDYPSLEVVVIDNDSEEPATLAYLEEIAAGPGVRVVHHHGPFNYSAINNSGIALTDGEVIGLLNNDIEIIHRDWLDEMVGQLYRDGVGTVGAMLYYPHNTIQHAGVILGPGGVAGHAHINLPRGTPGYFGRAELSQQLNAVTGACLLMHRRVFEEVGGFDETNLKVAFNDIDLCIRIRVKGHKIIWTPFAELYHHESATRGMDTVPEKRARFQSEVEYMRRTWAPLLDNDVFYNPNLTLNNAPFQLAATSRAPKPWIS